MSLRVLLTMFFCLMATIAAADSVDISFNDDSFQLGYDRPLISDNYGATLASGRFLYNGDKETRLGSLGLDFIGNPGNVPGLRLGAGTRFYAGRSDSDIDFVNLAVGLRGDYVLPQLQGFGVAGHLYYAPKVFSFQDSERLLESDVRLTYMVLPKVKLYLGYQNIRLAIEHGDNRRTIDSSVRIGFVASF